MKLGKKLFVAIISAAFLILPLSADTDDHDEIDEKYYHTHDDSTIAHDLTLALINFEQDRITDPSSQLVGEWGLVQFETTDGEMEQLVNGGTFNIVFNVTETYMQVSLVVKSNGKEYADPAVNYTIHDGQIDLDNADFQAGLKGDFLVYTMLGMDEAYRYTFMRK